MEGSPIKGTMHNSAVTYTSSRRQYVRAALCDMCWCRVSLWRQRRMHSMSVVTWGEAVRSSHSLSLSLSLRILAYRIVCFSIARLNLQSCEAERSRTLREQGQRQRQAGTGGQFDTTQRHLITPVVDKTHFRSCLLPQTTAGGCIGFCTHAGP